MDCLQAKEDSESDDDMPLVQRREILQEAEHKPLPVAVQKQPGKEKKAEGDEKNLVKKRPAEGQKAQGPPPKKAKPEPKASSSDEDDDRPLSAVKASVKKANDERKAKEQKAKVEKKKVKVEAGKKPVKREAPKTPERKKAPKVGEDNGTAKWTTLEHNGVIFPPPYQPHGVKMLYDGKPVSLTPEQEEVRSVVACTTITLE